MEHQIALKVQEKVLTVGTNRFHGAARKPLGPAVTALVAALRRLDPIRNLSFQNRPDATRRVMNRVPFRHQLRG